MRRLALLAALALLVLPAAAVAKDPEHIDPATVLKVCGPKYPPPCAPTAPKVTHQPAPNYSTKARDQKIEGIVVLHVIIGTDGRAHNIIVARSVGYGLDEAAIAAVKKWKFRPALDDQGKPVPVAINIEINFHLF